MTALPGDLDVARQLVAVRASVIEATQHVRSPKRSTRYRTTRNLIIAGAAIAALTAGAFVVAQFTQGTVDTHAACYAGPTLDGEPVLIVKQPESYDTVFDLCALVWRNDMFDPANNNDPDPNDGTSRVPPLVACTRNDGIAAVFPLPDGASEESFCETLGLADWDSD